MKKRIVSLALALMMCLSLSVTAFAVENEFDILYTEGYSLTYDEITEAPEYLKDGDFKNGEIINGTVSFKQPTLIEIPLNTMTGRATRERTISFQDYSVPTIASLKTLNNHISLNIGYFNVYHISDGPNVPTYSFDDVRYRVLLCTSSGATVENVYSTLGESFQKIFWDLSTSKTYTLKFYVIDSLPSQYIAEADVLVTNVVE